MLIYKLFKSQEWSALDANGSTKGAPIDLSDGYVHFSTGAQVRETAAKWFRDAEGLFLIACSASELGDDLKWEVSRGGDKFPHLYREMRMSDVLWHRPLPLVDGVHQFPKDVA